MSALYVAENKLQKKYKTRQSATTTIQNVDVYTHMSKTRNDFDDCQKKKYFKQSTNSHNDDDGISDRNECGLLTITFVAILLKFVHFS